MFIIPTEFQGLNKKVFYDQKKLKIMDQAQGQALENFYYIESKEQIFDDWNACSHGINANNMER